MTSLWDSYSPTPTLRLVRIALLAAVAIALGFIEALLPLPTLLPGAKLGLGNICVLVALYCLDVPSAAIVALLKALASGLLFGSPISLAFSLTGSALAFLGMCTLRAFPQISIVFVSVVAAVLHNIGQLACAALFLENLNIVALALPLLVVACVTGTLTGIVAAAVIAALRTQNAKNL